MREKFLAKQVEFFENRDMILIGGYSTFTIKISFFFEYIFLSQTL